MAARASARQRALHRTVADDLVQVQSATLPQLRAIWAERLGEDPPTFRSREIYRRMLAYRLQEFAEGGLSAPAKRKLRELEARFFGPKRAPVAPLVQLRPGVTLARDWQGLRHEVVVGKEGFDYDGATYVSLSEIARLITGTRWNGPLFFGLREKSGKAPA